jgi:hypothetical protein
MSRITDYVLTCSMHEEVGEDNTWETPEGRVRLWSCYRCIDMLNEQLHAAGVSRLANLDSYMSGKVAGCVLWGGCLNHFPLVEMARLIIALPWRYPESVLLLVQDDEEEAMTAYTLAQLRIYVAMKDSNPT